MKTRRVDPQIRKEQILAFVVQEYIRNVTPVSSSQIVKEQVCDLSSATIRNILADLEDEGYLMHPHTSAGRVPTQQGYRYYVKNLMFEIELLAQEKKRIESEYRKGRNEVEKLLERTSEILAQETHYPSMISLDGHENVLFCRGVSFVAGYPEFHSIQRIQHMLEILEQKEKLLKLINREISEKIKIFIGQEIGLYGMEDCSLVLTSYGRKGGPSGRLAILGPTRMTYEKTVSTLEFLSELMNEVL